ncbi:alpha/beta hydrolase [Amycolatopsis acidiphila]|uniref:alpha/beta hydrolase n=1 Tax=Amycolatopsis acidiphila TaxID=715473 RepID=UPI001E4FA31F|nr:alpha/beta hydrolase [Amycolatopsis acidiphila]UIJ57738.1 alpha/beta hydrolase [Amycolatopsis acidiphila]
MDWWPSQLPEDVTISQRTLITADGEVTRGTLYRPRRATETVFCLMHPRQDLRQHPFVPGLLAAGHAVWAQVGRSVGNDMQLVHESALLDVAAGVESLRDAGFGQIILIGHSGGSGLYSFYTEQALTEPARRIARTPGGAPTKLPEAPMPEPDGLVLVAPHPGQGRLLLAAIDPSVADENDPFSLIPELDPFARDNGFGDPPEGSHYSPEFVARYRQAQRDRVARIDSRAHELIADQLAVRKKVKSGTATETERRRSILTPVITTYRTDADLRCMDLGLDPSERPYGSVISARPAVSNFGVNGFGRLTTPEAWLSTWSGLSSNASLERALAGVTVPTLLIEFTGDCSVFPGDIEAALKTLAAADVRRVAIRADHFGRPLDKGGESGIAPAVGEIVTWSQERAK